MSFLGVFREFDFLLLGVLLQRWIVLFLSEKTGVHEAFRALDVGNHPEDEKYEEGAENEERQVYAECGGSVEGLESILQQDSENGEDQGQHSQVQPQSPARNDQTEIAARGGRVRRLFGCNAHAIVEKDMQYRS